VGAELRAMMSWLQAQRRPEAAPVRR